MVDFQQIIEWINLIRGLINKYIPVANRIKEEATAKAKTLNGVQFLDLDNPSVSNIQQLNQILRENGLEEIDENLFAATLIDQEEVLRRMQQEFTEDELAAAVSASVTGSTDPAPEEDFTQLDYDLADVCDPPVVIETPDFSLSEIVDVACKIPSEPVDVITDPIGSIPTEPPVVEESLDQTAVPQPQENIFEELSKIPPGPLGGNVGLGGNANPKNGPECLAKMQEVSNKIQEKINAYTSTKEEIQKIQLDYFYETIADAYYQSFIKGYGEVEALRKELESLDLSKQIGLERKVEIEERLRTLPNEFLQFKEKSLVEDLLRSAIFTFSNQFDVDIDTGFLGLFESYPKVLVNKEKTPLEGKVKSIPDELIKFIDEFPKDDPNASADITKKANESEKALQDAFNETVTRVKYVSFGFGYGSYVEKESIEKEFLDTAAAQNEKKNAIEKQYNDLKQKEKESQDAINEINNQIMEELKKLNCESTEVPAKVEAGKDLNFKNVSKNPTIFDYAWWVKFSKLATIVNLVPVHWPVGLLIPTPSGLIKVPFPIIWIPLFVAPTDKLIAVIFIGQCGILPCPFIFLQHFLPIPLGPFISNNPYFALAIRGPINISSHEPLPGVTIPTFNPVFLALNAVLAAVRGQVTTDFNLLVQEVKNQIENVEQQALQYLANIDTQANQILLNARDQALASVRNVKNTAELAIKQAQEEGQRLIQEARNRYGDANALNEATLLITRGVQAKINEATALVEEARRYSEELIKEAEEKALNLRNTAEETVKSIIEQGKRQYEQRLAQIEELEEQYQQTLETLRELINKIRVPAIDLEKNALSILLNAYKAALGSLQSLAASISPFISQFGFPTEIDPKFSFSLPIFKDELPPWERLSLLNIPFLFFLWKWCKAGKEKGGFFRDPF